MTTIYVPRSFGSTLIIRITPPPVQRPGTATVTDKSMASSRLSNTLVPVASTNDQSVALSTLTDKLG